MQSENVRIEILGAGFGGLWAARALSCSQTRTLLLDCNNYHTFHPLLYQAAAAEVEREEIIYPIRNRNPKKGALSS